MYFQLGSTMYRSEDIVELSLPGCWGKIKMKGGDLFDIGDGSYENCPRHITHKVAYKSDGTPDFRFVEMHKIMARMLMNEEKAG